MNTGGLIFTDDDLYFKHTLSEASSCLSNLKPNRKKNGQMSGFYSREYWMDRSLVMDRLEKFFIED